jgi:hypothetical protein
MNELDIYNHGQDILNTICFPDYETKKEFNIFFRGIFDIYGTLYSKTIFKSDLHIELCLNNTEIISNFLKKVDDLLEIKWQTISKNTLVLKNNDAKKFLDIIYIDSDARYRNENKYNSYLRWLINKNNSIISFKTELTLNNVIFPIKNNIGYNITVITLNKKIGKNTFIYDTGIKVNVDFGYKIKITCKCSLINYGFILNNYLVKKDESIKIILSKIDNSLKNFKLPYTGFNLVIEKIYFYELEIL